MKLSIPLACLAALIYLQSCGGRMIKNDGADTSLRSSDNTGGNNKVAASKATDNLVIKDAKDLIGYWVGKFEADVAIDPIYAGERTAWDYTNKINISIDEINGDTVKGHSVVAGNYRPFMGTVEKERSVFRFYAQEPGDDKYDGIFKFSISQGDSVLAGTWKANHKIRIPARKYALSKKIFHYNPHLQMQVGMYLDWNKKKKVTYEVGDSYDISYFTTSGDVNKYNASTDLLTAQQLRI